MAKKHKSSKNAAVATETVEVQAIETATVETVGNEAILDVTQELTSGDDPTVTDTISAEDADAMARFAEGDDTALDGITQEAPAASEEIDAATEALVTASIGDEEAPAPEGETVSSEPAAEGEPNEPKPLAEVLAAIDDEDATLFALEMGHELDRREAFEKSLPDYNDRILKSLSKARNKLATVRAARVLMAANVDPRFMNREVHSGARYNVYALDKLADIVNSLIDANTLGNAINRACMVSLFRAKANGYAFTLDTAKACASHHIPVSDTAVKKWLLRHTVATSTAPTQASSTMQALTTIGIVRPDGSTKRPTYTILDNPLSRAAAEVCSKITDIRIAA